MTLQLILFSSLVYLPLALGALVRHKGLLKRDISKPVMQSTWLTLEPIVCVIAFWKLNLQQLGDLAAAPVLGTAWMLAMLVPASIAATRLQLTPIRRGNFLLAAMFSNNGITLGAFICFVFFGIEGQALSMLFVLGFTPLLLTVGFHIGQRSARQGALAGSAPADPPQLGMLRVVPYASMAAGIALNLAHVPQPAFCLDLNRVLVFLDVGIYSLAIGTLFDLASVRTFLRECLVMSGLKFVASPLIALALFIIASQVMHLSPLLLKVMVVQCAMPVAIMSVVVSRFCQLDMGLSAGCWVFTTLAVIAVLPIISAVIGLLG